MIKVVSVDWDFFFPDLLWYDWGHREAPLFFEFAWATRVASRHLKTGALALDEVEPRMSDLSGFWNRVIAPGSKPSFVILSESHADLFPALRQLFGGLEVWNFDQHHDLGYGSRGEKSPKDCGSWAFDLRRCGALDAYHLVYPSWRREEQEHAGDVLRQRLRHKRCHCDVSYGLEGFRPVDADIVFACRSYAWTPPWADDAWLAFSDGARKLAGPQTRVMEGKTVKDARRPSMAEARRDLPSLLQVFSGTVPATLGSS